MRHPQTAITPGPHGSSKRRPWPGPRRAALLLAVVLAGTLGAGASALAHTDARAHRAAQAHRGTPCPAKPRARRAKAKRRRGASCVRRAAKPAHRAAKPARPASKALALAHPSQTGSAPSAPASSSTAATVSAQAGDGEGGSPTDAPSEAPAQPGGLGEGPLQSVGSGEQPAGGGASETPPQIGGESSEGASQVADSWGTGLDLVDYFPSADGWGSMWWDWNPTQMEADFTRIADLHANAVRIIVSAPAFGFPRPSALMMSRLWQTVALAAAHGLRVELTLFNEWSDYSAVAESETWAGELLAPFKGSSEIAYIDLHNELPAQTDAAAAAWAQAMVPFVRGIDGGVPVTVSTSISSGVEPLEALVKALAADPPTFYDVHYYGAASDAYAVLAQAKQVAGSIPIFVGETGFATNASYGWAEGLQPDEESLDAYQDYYFRMVEYATQVLGLAPAAPWILYDMPGQGGTVWGEHMGILHADGAPKPAASTLASVFAGEPVELSFNNDFEQSSGDPAMPSIWREWLAGEARFSVDKTVAYSGSASARIEDAEGDHLTGCPAFYAAPVAAIVPGVTYTAGAWVRGQDTGGESRVVLSWSDAQGHYVSSSSSASLPAGTSGWTHLSVSAQPPAGAAAVEINLQVCENPGTTWFDDVSFSPTS